ncbi:antitoxin [Candidatus Electronema sp. JM]
METAKLFTNGRSQVVRLPKAFRLEGKEVFIKKPGQAS